MRTSAQRAKEWPQSNRRRRLVRQGLRQLGRDKPGHQEHQSVDAQTREQEKPGKRAREAGPDPASMERTLMAQYLGRCQFLRCRRGGAQRFDDKRDDDNGNEARQDGSQYPGLIAVPHEQRALRGRPLAVRRNARTAPSPPRSEPDHPSYLHIQLIDGSQPCLPLNKLSL